MKKISAYLIHGALILFIPALLGAEAVFLKDGSIIEGRISSENDTELTIKTQNMGQLNIKRDRVMRTLYNNDYKTKSYIYMNSGGIIEGFVVHEDAASYTIRKELLIPDEKRISKSEVQGVMKKKIATRPQAAPSRGKKPRIINPDYEPYSAGKAVFASLLPVYSGSWNIAFSVPGVIFVAVKCIGLSALIYNIAYFDSYESYDVYDSEGYYMETYDNSDDYFSSIAGVWISTVIILAGIITDAVYSGIKVSRYNRQNMYLDADSGMHDRGSFAWKAEPRVYYAAMNGRTQARGIDGVNISASVKF